MRISMNISLLNVSWLYNEMKHDQRGTRQLRPHPPIVFKKVEIFIPLEVYTYLVTTCLILLTTSTWLRRYEIFSCSGYFSKSTLKNGLSWLLNFAPSTIILVWRENSEACLCSSLNRYKINRTLCKLWHFGVE